MRIFRSYFPLSTITPRARAFVHRFLWGNRYYGKFALG